MYSQTIHKVDFNGKEMQGYIVEASRLKYENNFKLLSRVDIACTSSLSSFTQSSSILGESNIHNVPIGRTPRCKARITILNKVPTRRRTSQPSMTVDMAIRIVLTLQR